MTVVIKMNDRYKKFTTIDCHYNCTCTFGYDGQIKKTIDCPKSLFWHSDGTIWCLRNDIYS